MKKNNYNLPIYIFILLTVSSYAVGIYIPEIIDVVGASSILQLLFFSLGASSKILFLIDIAYCLSFIACIIWCIRVRNISKKVKIFTCLLVIDILISITLAICETIIVDSTNLTHYIIGVVIRASFIGWEINQFNEITKKENIGKTDAEKTQAD